MGYSYVENKQWYNPKENKEGRESNGRTVWTMVPGILVYETG